MKRALLLAFFTLASLTFAAERATFDSAGKLTSLIDHGATLPVRAGLYAELQGDVRVGLQPHDQRSPITRAGLENRWNGTTTFPNGAEIRFTADWSDAGPAVVLKGTVAAQSPFIDTQALEFVIDLPRETFVDGKFGAEPLPATKGSAANIFAADLERFSVSSADASWQLTVVLDRARPVRVTDTWDAAGRSYRIHVSLQSGLLAQGETLSFSAAFTPAARPAAAPALVRIEEHTTRYAFDGFGGNLCFATDTPVADYNLDQLRSAWARLELKAQAWDRERGAPGPQLKRDFELMQRVQKQGIPWVISLWRIPERFYEEPNRKPLWTFGRRVAADRWPELLDLIGSYLVYLKSHYGAEPDLFSFNEPDLGVSVGFSADGHRDAIRRIGAHLAGLGLKTRLLLGDTANPRDSHRYVLPTAADPDAMRYVAAVSFHSWGSGTPEQYRAWAEVAHWLKLPLLVGEAGVDPGSYRNRMFDSYAYGLTEMQQYQELLRDSTPQALIYWQYTEDYGLVRKLADGRLEPTGRFWLMKHFTDLTPAKSEVLASQSDQPDVLVSAFRRGDALAVHLLNLGAEREVTLQGLEEMDWSVVTTTEETGFARATHTGAVDRLKLPARSLTTLVRGQ